MWTPHKWFLEQLIPHHEDIQDVHAFIQYSGMALLDPKMPIELKVAGPAYVAGNVFGVGALLWWLDPLDYRPNRGLDETWTSGFNPAYSWTGEVADGSTSWIPEEPPAPWEFGWLFD